MKRIFLISVLLIVLGSCKKVTNQSKAPKFMSVNIYDYNGDRIPMQPVAERHGLSEGKEKEVKQDQAKEEKQTPAEG